MKERRRSKNNDDITIGNALTTKRWTQLSINLERNNLSYTYIVNRISCLQFLRCLYRIQVINLEVPQERYQFLSLFICNETVSSCTRSFPKKHEKLRSYYYNGYLVSSPSWPNKTKRWIRATLGVRWKRPESHLYPYDHRLLDKSEWLL